MGHVIADCYTRARLYGPYPNRNRSFNPNFQPLRNNPAYNPGQNRNNPNIRNTTERLNFIDIHERNNQEYTWNSDDPDPHNLKSLTLSPPENSKNKGKINETPDIEPIRPTKLENWENQSNVKPSFSIAPFITRLTHILCLLMIIPGLFAFPNSNKLTSYNPQNPMICQTEQQGEYWTLPNFAPCPRLKQNRFLVST
ncbi:unnamed protein product [Meloidogyne enterolobii]|uniref:Uncharacterized protein n=1 Tax=Meloidogyne enterolobii TaxID=390850 RepID=A0ACB0YH25_MELEN